MIGARLANRRGHRSAGDASFQTVYRYFSNPTAGRPAIDIGQVKSRMQSASDEVLGPGQVKDVVIQSALGRRKF